VVEIICDSIVARAARGDNFGVALIPEGLVEFVPEIKALIAELNDAMAGSGAPAESLPTEARMEWLSSRLSRESFAALSSMPREIAEEFLADRDPHGNVQVSNIRTEKLLIGMIRRRLHDLRERGLYAGRFAAQSHFFGYEGRCAFPTNFDADYCYALGYSAFLLAACGLSGYLASVRRLIAPAHEWQAGGIPLTGMMNMEQRHGERKPVIRKALVELDGRPFREFASMRDEWALETRYVVPGGIQYYGPPELCDEVPVTLRLERG